MSGLRSKPPWPCPAVTDTSDRLKGLEVRMAEGSGKRRFFPEAFKLEAVAAVRGGRSVSQVAAELGLPDRLVRSPAMKVVVFQCPCGIEARRR